jgi:hypothetical protein
LDLRLQPRLSHGVQTRASTTFPTGRLEAPSMPVSSSTLFGRPPQVSIDKINDLKSERASASGGIREGGNYIGVNDVDQLRAEGGQFRDVRSIRRRCLGSHAGDLG